MLLALRNEFIITLVEICVETGVKELVDDRPLLSLMVMMLLIMEVWMGPTWLAATLGLPLRLLPPSW